MPLKAFPSFILDCTRFSAKGGNVSIRSHAQRGVPELLGDQLVCLNACLRADVHELVFSGIRQLANAPGYATPVGEHPMHGRVLDVDPIVGQLPDELRTLHLLEGDAHEKDAVAHVLPHLIHELWRELQIGARGPRQWVVRYRLMIMQQMADRHGDAMRQPVAEHVLPFEIHHRLRLALRDRVALHGPLGGVGLVLRLVDLHTQVLARCFPMRCLEGRDALQSLPKPSV